METNRNKTSNSEGEENVSNKKANPKHESNKKQVTFENLNHPVNHRKRNYSKKTGINSGAWSGDEELHNDHHSRKNFKGSMRKRSYSFTEGHPPKRWKSHINKNRNRFLLGGNSRDPLNLNSLADERIFKIMNAVTPVTSPLPTPQYRKEGYRVDVLIPPNISDPLNLNCGVDDNNYESQFLISPGISLNKKKKVRHRKRFRLHHSKSNQPTCHDHEENESENALHSDNDFDEKDSSPELPAKKLPKIVVNKSQELFPSSKNNHTNAKNSKYKNNGALNGGLSKTKSEESSNDKQLEEESSKVKKDEKPPEKKEKSEKLKVEGKGKGKEKGKGKHKSKRRHQNKERTKNIDHEFNAKKQCFEYGNYNRYYGYRNPNFDEPDARLRHFRKQWFENKDVLDIGCNVGKMTLAVAKNFHVKSMIGIDIDKKLIDGAKKKLRQMICCQRSDGKLPYPINLPEKFGSINPVSRITEPKAKPIEGQFPNNVKFVYGNYVLENDALLEAVQPEFDVIMCLSTTKWFHLNYGDEGIKRAFKRMYAQLRHGGILILECQGIQSYRKKKKLTEQIFQNFQNIKLFPEHFAFYLIHEVGFENGETIAIPNHSSKGFQRPLQVFFKPFPFSPFSSRQSTPYVNYSLGPSPFWPSPFGPSPFYCNSSANTPYHHASYSRRNQNKPNCYAPILTTQSKTPPGDKEKEEEKSPKADGENANANCDDTNKDGNKHDKKQKSQTNEQSSNENDEPIAGPSKYDNFSRPFSFPDYSPAQNNYYLGPTPNYSPCDTPSYPGYSGFTPGHTGLTPGYSGPSPEAQDSTAHSPVYTGPEPDANNVDSPRYTPSYNPSNPGSPNFNSPASSPQSPGIESPPNHSPVYNSSPSMPSPQNNSQSLSPPTYNPESPSYQPSHSPGLPSYSPNSPSYSPSYSPCSSSPRVSTTHPDLSPRANSSNKSFSPGNATPKTGQTTPKENYSSTSPSMTPSPRNSSSSPQVQQSEVTGNTTPYAGPSGTTSQNPKYYWYGNEQNSNQNSPSSSPSMNPNENSASGSPNAGHNYSISQNRVSNEPPNLSPRETSGDESANSSKSNSPYH